VKVVLCGVHVVECLRLAGVYRRILPRRPLPRPGGQPDARGTRGRRMLAQEQKLRRAGLR